MKIKMLAAAALLSLAISSPTFAIVPQPEKCPSVDLLQQSNIEHASYMEEHHAWIAIAPPQNYDTKDKWVLMVMPILAKDESEAVVNGQKSLNFIKFLKGPESTIGPMWDCTYTNNSNQFIIANTGFFIKK